MKQIGIWGDHFQVEENGDDRLPERKYGERTARWRPKGGEVRVTDAEGEAAEKLLHYGSFGVEGAENEVTHNAESVSG